jgi:broad specificity phosphatase PhoE
LTATGRAQAGAVAARLADQTASPALPIPAGPPVEIAHSPLGRATETAEAIASARTSLSPTLPSTPRRADAGFAEIAQGAWEGLHRTEISTRYAAELAAWRATPASAPAPGGETLAEVRERVRDGLARTLSGLVTDAPPANLDMVAGYAGSRGTGPWSILVGHDGVFKVTMLTLFDLPLERFWMWSFDLCGIGVVEFRGGRPILRAHNLTDHLAPRLDEASLAERAAREATGAL